MQYGFKAPAWSGAGAWSVGMQGSGEAMERLVETVEAYADLEGANYRARCEARGEAETLRAGRG